MPLEEESSCIQLLVKKENQGNRDERVIFGAFRRTASGGGIKTMTGGGSGELGWVTKEDRREGGGPLSIMVATRR